MPTPRLYLSSRIVFRIVAFALLLLPSAVKGAAAQDKAVAVTPAQDKGITLTLSGTVLAGGAAVPNATVTATNKATGMTRTTTTDSDGKYAISNLVPGQYTVKVSIAGFKEMVRETSLEIGAVSSLNIDLDVLPVGSTLFGEIKGTIRDEKGNPIEGASIEFVPDDESDSVSETSSKDGTYSRDSLRAGTYDVVVKAAGHVQAKKRVKLAAHEQKTEDFKLKPTP